MSPKNHKPTYPEVEHFSEMLASEVGASLNTISSYLSDINNFITFLNLNQLNLLTVTKDHIEHYIHSLAELGLSERTRARRLSSLKAFYTFLVRENKISSNPTKLVDRPKQGRRLPKFLGENETNLIINAAYTSDHPDQLRRILFIELLYATGMRISELLNLKLSDIQWQDECILITKGKGNKQRLVPFNQSTKHAITQYLQSLHRGSSPWLFPSKQLKKPLTRQRFFQLIKELAVEAGIDPHKVSPHVIRHAFATHLLNNGANLINVQKLLGHTDITTTEIYTHIASEKLKETVFKHHPLASSPKNKG